MIQTQTYLEVADNTGARKIMCIRVLKGSNAKYATVGDVIVASVKEAIPRGAVKEGDVVKAVVVRTKKEVKRPDGSAIRFDDNAAVIIDPKTKDPIASRVFGPIAREIKDRGYAKIASLAQEVV